MMSIVSHLPCPSHRKQTLKFLVILTANPGFSGVN